MFPGVNGFHWTFGHILFVSVFFAVLLTVAGTVVFALVRSRQAIRKRRTDDIRWHHEFHELASRDRRCRHELSGRAEDRVCPNAFDCRVCTDHARFAGFSHRTKDEVYGLSYPVNRYYHRGHTWVEEQPDGTLTVGLDDIASHIIDRPDSVELPRAGSRVTANGSGWRLFKEGYDVRVLAPVDGEVLEAGGPDHSFYLRIRPELNDGRFRHLLHGDEVEAWVGRELERLYVALGPENAAPSLADGGELMRNLIQNVPGARWDTILGEVFLEP